MESAKETVTTGRQLVNHREPSTEEDMVESDSEDDYEICILSSETSDSGSDSENSDLEVKEKTLLRKFRREY